MKALKRCNACNTYTLKTACPRCHTPTSSAHPPKYSKEDPFREYRRKALYSDFVEP